MNRPLVFSGVAVLLLALFMSLAESQQREASARQREESAAEERYRLAKEKCEHLQRSEEQAECMSQAKNNLRRQQDTYDTDDSRQGLPTHPAPGTRIDVSPER